MIVAEINQSMLRGGQRLPRRLIERTLRATSKILGLRRSLRISLALVGQGQMRELNRKYRGQDKVTDVLSFNMPNGDVLGEVIICYEQARRQARQLGHSVRQELIFLLVHGLLHLLGYDHERVQDAAKMFKRQAKILDSLHVEAL